MKMRIVRATKEEFELDIRQGLPDYKPVEMEALAGSSTVSETTVCEAGNTLNG